ncbi:hypothetical protein [Pseudomonas sp.]|uniref:pPIWI-associating nuclease domain-containing protein n=1 Tax=Pseudomonas sp. TaxID=306 RepID=UPI003C72EEA3
MNERIIEILAQGFERELFTAALNNLADSSNPLRLNNFAYAMRELTRHVLHRLAPDESVRKCRWYRDESNGKNEPTRRQRACYAVQGGLSDEYVQDILGLEVAEMHSRLSKAIRALSKLTHIEESVFALPEEVVQALSDDTVEAVAGLCNAILECRREIITALWEQIDQAAVEQLLSETLLAIDEIAPHHSIEEIYTDRIEIISITHDQVNFVAEGSVTAGLQWGSNSDIRRGDGITGTEDFPFTCQLWSPVEAPDEVETSEEGPAVDTSSWWDGYYDEEPEPLG